MDLTNPDSTGMMISLQYIFTEAGKEVTHMFNFYAKNEEQYEQFNQLLISGNPETT